MFLLSNDFIISYTLLNLFVKQILRWKCIDKFSKFYLSIFPWTFINYFPVKLFHCVRYSSYQCTCVPFYQNILVWLIDWLIILTSNNWHSHSSLLEEYNHIQNTLNNNIQILANIIDFSWSIDRVADYSYHN